MSKRFLVNSLTAASTVCFLSACNDPQPVPQAPQSQYNPANKLNNTSVDFKVFDHKGKEITDVFTNSSECGNRDPKKGALENHRMVITLGGI